MREPLQDLFMATGEVRAKVSTAPHRVCVHSFKAGGEGRVQSLPDSHTHAAGYGVAPESSSQSQVRGQGNMRTQLEDNSDVKYEIRLLDSVPRFEHEGMHSTFPPEYRM